MPQPKATTESDATQLGIQRADRPETARWVRFEHIR